MDEPDPIQNYDAWISWIDWLSSLVRIIVSYFFKNICTFKNSYFIINMIINRFSPNYSLFSNSFFFLIVFQSDISKLITNINSKENLIELLREKRICLCK